MIWKAALDYSGSEIIVSVLNEQNSLVADSCTDLPGRDSSSLPLIVEDTLAQAHLKLEDISEWTLGMGPGSFTALRVAAAYVLGVVYGRLNHKTLEALIGEKAEEAAVPADDVNLVSVRGVPSACGLPRQGERVLTLYDGRKKELLAYGLKLENGSYIPDGRQCVLENHDALEAVKSEYDAFVARACDMPAVRAFAPELTVQEVAHVDGAALARLPKGVCDLPPTEPIYLRPAVFVDPKPIRKFEV